MEDPCNFTTQMVVSKVGNLSPTVGQLLESRILHALLVGEKQHKIARIRFCTQSCSIVGQLLVNSLHSPHPWEVAGVFVAVGFWQHPNSADPFCARAEAQKRSERLVLSQVAHQREFNMNLLNMAIHSQFPWPIN